MGPHPGRKLITLKAGGVKAAGRAKALRKPAGAPAAPKKPPVRPVGTSDVAKARRVARDAALEWLAITYPAAFGSDPKPLALGIGRAIWPAARAAGIKRKAFNAAIGRRVHSPAYLAALAAEGAQRFGLDGVAVEPVSPAHQALAIETMTKNACNQRSAVND